jgi:hypothetical protein
MRLWRIKAWFRTHNHRHVWAMEDYEPYGGAFYQLRFCTKCGCGHPDEW